MAAHKAWHVLTVFLTLATTTAAQYSTSSWPNRTPQESNRITTGPWLPGRATFAYNNDGMNINDGSCGYGNVVSLGNGLNVAAISDQNPTYSGSCGRCYEMSCRPAVLSDDYGDTVDRTTACGSATAAVNITIVDTCPCVYPANAYSNKRWCCGDETHFDMSYWALTELAQPKWGVIGIYYRQIPCDSPASPYWQGSLPFTSQQPEPVPDTLPSGQAQASAMPASPQPESLPSASQQEPPPSLTQVVAFAGPSVGSSPPDSGTPPPALEQSSSPPPSASSSSYFPPYSGDAPPPPPAYPVSPPPPAYNSTSPPPPPHQQGHPPSSPSLPPWGNANAMPPPPVPQFRQGSSSSSSPPPPPTPQQKQQQPSPPPPVPYQQRQGLPSPPPPSFGSESSSQSSKSNGQQDSPPPPPPPPPPPTSEPSIEADMQALKHYLQQQGGQQSSSSPPPPPPPPPPSSGVQQQDSAYQG